MITPRQVFDHALNREYMSGIARDKLRIKATAEVFTPDELVCEILDKLQELDKETFRDIDRGFCDPCAGDGQFLAWTLFYKLIKADFGKINDKKFMESDVTPMFKRALKSIYGVDIMPDNVRLCRERLLCGQEHLRHIVVNNIRCEDATKYDFSFE